eukprot:GHVR01132893.1.p1 GENE.GHVR01132893.1~~GHVR01132893.1.p1  ORF type:complete len:124 (-),score=28.14 GHVR01132893.1:76-447(-)
MMHRVVVGGISHEGVITLFTDDHIKFDIPTILLPPDVSIGQTLEFAVRPSLLMDTDRYNAICQLQCEVALLVSPRLGVPPPDVPQLRVGGGSDQMGRSCVIEEVTSADTVQDSSVHSASAGHS